MFFKSIRSFFFVSKENRKLREENEKLKEEARTDYMTGLLNRKGIEEKIQEEVERVKRYDTFGFAILFLDIDKLKETNDVLGYERGDMMIDALADVINNNLRKTDSGGRVGGDEFIILLPETNKEEAQTVSKKIKKELKSSFVSVSIGCSYYSQKENDFKKVRKEAYKEMQREKRKK